MNVNFNILNQKGAPAVYEDSLTNIPAPSYPGRLFVDTDQPTSTGIYRDTGTSWQQIAGGGGTNIYNSDGTLNSPRNVDCANLDLNFTNAFQFSIQSSIKNTQFLIDQFGNIRTSYNAVTDGIWLIPDNAYRFGQFSQIGLTNKGTYIECDVQNNKIEYAVNLYTASGQPKTLLRQTNNGLTLIFGNGINGINLNCNNRIYNFGQITGGNQTRFDIDDNAKVISSSANFNGYLSEGNLRKTTLGITSAVFNETKFIIDDINQIIVTTNQTINKGIDINFATNNYIFGYQNFGYYLNCSSASTSLFHNVLMELNTTIFRFKIATGGSISALENNVANGLVIDYNAKKGQYGINSTGNNRNVIEADGTTRQIRTLFNSTDYNGINIDFTNTKYQLGQLTAGNGTYLTIEDAATYPVQIDGTNVISGTSGSTSGQHLKIKINGTDYKIELRNP